MRALLLCCLCAVPFLSAAPRKIIFGSPSADLADFERFAVRPRSPEQPVESLQDLP